MSDKNMITPVILSGGSGTRLWPMSRSLYPKQLLPLLGGDETLLQSTLIRLKHVRPSTAPMAICNEEHRFVVASQAQAAGTALSGIILEPEGRNTAPAIAVAALIAGAGGRDPMLLVMPADHHIADPEAFGRAVSMGREAAGAGWLVAFGIVPDSPHTGYGYIRMDARDGSRGVVPVVEFVEKPDQAAARKYLDSGEYLWNSGIYLFRASAYLEELGRFNPEILAACTLAVEKASSDLDFTRLDKQAFLGCPADSIDYAVMEKTDKAVVAPLACGWSDVGSWAALHAAMGKDSSNNVLVGDARAVEVNNSLVCSSSRLVTALGVSNLAIVETKDAVMVSTMDRVQDVREMVSTLKSEGRPEVHVHPKVFRPWGNYEQIDAGPRYQVKRITVYPGQALSLQKHFHRAEHWVVVTGTAKVTRGEEEILLTEDQSVYVPLGQVHRLENVGRLNLELIEVQTGSYLGEDDIVRLDDVYGRLEGGKT